MNYPQAEGGTKVFFKESEDVTDFVALSLSNSSNIKLREIDSIKK